MKKSEISAKARKVFEQSVPARSNLEFVRQLSGNQSTTPSKSENIIADNVSSVDFKECAKEIFYGVDYTAYPFSLPVGAGKTFLMAWIIYLDLYFAQTEPDNELFAHNFLVLIPSA